jgi:argininosuccinate lyase
VDTLIGALALTAPMLSSMKVNVEKMRENAQSGFANATDLADYLVKKGLPFREAHEVVGRLVLYCLERGKVLTDLELAEFKAASPLIKADVYEALQLERVVDARNIPGGTGRQSVLTAIKEKKSKIDETHTWLNHVTV